MSEKSLADFLRSPKARIIAQRLVSQKKSINLKSISDYDVYSILCESISLLALHPIRKELISSHFTVLGQGFSPMLLTNDIYRKEAWKGIFLSQNNIFSQNEYEYIKAPFEFWSVERKELHLNDEIALIDFENLNEKSPFALLDFLLNRIKKEKIEALAIDMRRIKYIRPDDFHANECFGGLCAGKNEDSSILILWLLCRALMNSNVDLRIISNEVKGVENLHRLFNQARVYPKIKISMDIESSEFIELAPLIEEKNISLEFFATKEIEKYALQNQLTKLLNAIPLAVCSFSQRSFDKSRLCCEMLAILEKELGCEETKLAFSELYEVE